MFMYMQMLFMPNIQNSCLQSHQWNMDRVLQDKILMPISVSIVMNKTQRTGEPGVKVSLGHACSYSTQ
jgi:hypothetical protein